MTIAGLAGLERSYGSASGASLRVVAIPACSGRVTTVLEVRARNAAARAKAEAFVKGLARTGGATCGE